MFSFRSLCYFAYAFLLTAVLLYVRFPAEKFKEFCEKRIEHLLPGSSCNIDHIVYRFPLSTVLESIVISRVVDGQESDMVVDRLAISPEPLQFWKAFKLKVKFILVYLTQDWISITGHKLFSWKIFVWKVLRRENLQKVLASQIGEY
jgi:hypothetical protein